MAPGVHRELVALHVLGLEHLGARDGCWRQCSPTSAARDAPREPTMKNVVLIKFCARNERSRGV